MNRGLVKVCIDYLLLFAYCEKSKLENNLKNTESRIDRKFEFCKENFKMERLTGKKNSEQFLRRLDGFDVKIIVN